MDFKNKVALVTGGAKGIGKSIIEKFASLGCNVVINYNTSESEAIKLKHEIESKYNIKALIIKQLIFFSFS